MSDNTESIAIAGEQAYFESQGETPIESAAAPEEGETAAEPAEGLQEPEQQPDAHQKTVPLAALHEERKRIKELRRELDQTKELTRLGTERLNQLLAAMQQPQQKQELPDAQTDPVAHFDARLRQQQELLDRQNEVIQRAQQERAQQEQLMRLQSHVNAQEREFVAEKPDYMDAVNHLRNADVRALMAIGHDEATAAQIVHQNFIGLAAQLANQGANLPERVYALAQAKGYQPKQATPDAAQQRIATAQKGVAASRSLGSGAGTVNNLTLEALANMPAEEFAAATKDPAVFRRLMGG